MSWWGLNFHTYLAPCALRTLLPWSHWAAQHDSTRTGFCSWNPDLVRAVGRRAGVLPAAVRRGRALLQSAPVAHLPGSPSHRWSATWAPRRSQLLRLHWSEQGTRSSLAIQGATEGNARSPRQGSAHPFLPPPGFLVVFPGPAACRRHPISIPEGLTQTFLSSHVLSYFDEVFSPQ